MKLPYARLRELVEYLTGTCQSLAEGMRACGMDDHEETSVAVQVEEDGNIFLCDSCGWWCENDELNVVDCDQLCNDCKEDT